MVGDTIDTDIIFGNKSGLKTLLVLSGSTTRHHLTLNNNIYNVITKLEYLDSNNPKYLDSNNPEYNEVKNIIGKDLLTAYTIATTKAKEAKEADAAAKAKAEAKEAILKHNILNILYSNLISDDTYTKPTYIFDSLKELNSNIK
jgi:hypothetical protein